MTIVSDRSSDLALQEANHRIANHLAMLASTVQIQTSSLNRGPATLSRDEVKRMMQAVAGKIISVGYLHRRLANAPAGSDLDLADYLIEHSTNLISSLSLQNRVHVAHKLNSHCRIHADQAQALALIVSEILMNAVKHAHPTGLPVQIYFSCRRNADGGIALEVGDDGVGLPEEFDMDLDGGVGFKLIRSLADKLRAKLTIQSDSLGLSFHFRLPSN
jgi:two-component sensor histidine kinase